MDGFKSFVNADVAVKRWRLYLLRFILVFLGWTTVNLITVVPTKSFLLKIFTRAVAVSVCILLALFGLEANSRRTRNFILVLFAAVFIILLIVIVSGAGSH